MALRPSTGSRTRRGSNFQESQGHWAACWFWEEVSKDDDQEKVALEHGKPLPSDTTDYSLETVIPGSHGVLDPDNPLLPDAPDPDTNRV